jgi:hypothetical protein
MISHLPLSFNTCILEGTPSFKPKHSWKHRWHWWQRFQKCAIFYSSVNWKRLRCNLQKADPGARKAHGKRQGCWQASNSEWGICFSICIAFPKCECVFFSWSPVAWIQSPAHSPRLDCLLSWAVLPLIFQLFYALSSASAHFVGPGALLSPDAIPSTGCELNSDNVFRLWPPQPTIVYSCFFLLMLR